MRKGGSQIRGAVWRALEHQLVLHSEHRRRDRFMHVFIILKNAQLDHQAHPSSSVLTRISASRAASAGGQVPW